MQYCKATQIAKAEAETFDAVAQYQPVRASCGMKPVVDKLVQMQEANLQSELPRVKKQLVEVIAPLEKNQAALPLPPKGETELIARVVALKTAFTKRFEKKSSFGQLAAWRDSLKQELHHSLALLDGDTGKDMLLQLLADKGSYAIPGLAVSAPFTFLSDGTPGNVPPSAITAGLSKLTAKVRDKITVGGNDVLSAAIKVQSLNVVDPSWRSCGCLQLVKTSLAKLHDVEIATPLGRVLERQITARLTSRFRENEVFAVQRIDEMTTSPDWQSSELMARLQQLSQERHAAYRGR